MLKDNDTQFAAIGFEQVHLDGRRMVVLVARASYELSPDGSLCLVSSQRVVLSDLYDGNPHNGSLLKASDLAPFKPNSDVTVSGKSYAPNGEPSASWTSGVRVDDHSYVLRIHGPREWEPNSQQLSPSWKLGMAKKVTSVPVDYRHAAGGRVIGHPRGDADPYNPIGPGILDPKMTSSRFSYEAPQIDSAAHPILEWLRVGNRVHQGGKGQ